MSDRSSLSYSTSVWVVANPKGVSVIHDWCSINLSGLNKLSNNPAE